ncbi:catechol 2,3-dioxygenase-like lactoylglutathione lyase family enzyme [Chitinophaga skermanii]|uniref:Catechol 2,3-dioxygenase-like lactoylglutathione lyase family enzyme n=1 Tax=Chitinophaga skermanii TaxID=331697 RepID=A0A327Q2S8_9BACT|nr:VOC family protein [Chitinophaga skermanii]RAI98659.1 catechol 2,3-dioxygenase-like lactoylglutathione lyase family enzyme [Chitinophaga skermanii]
MITFKRVHHVQICIPPGAGEQARAYYSGVLGLKEINRPEPLANRPGMWFAMGDIELHIGEEANQSPSKRHPAFEVIDIESVRKYFLDKGMVVKDEIPIPGQTRFSIFDPFGNRIELLEKH